MNERYSWMQIHQEEFSLEKMAEALDVTPSGYYAWRKAPYSKRHQENDQLKQEIMKTWEQGRRRYGSPRITEVLRQKFRVGHNRVARLMREMGLQARSKKRWKVTTQSKHGLPIAENLLARNFEAKRPNEKWAGDISVPQQAA